MKQFLNDIIINIKQYLCFCIKLYIVKFFNNKRIVFIYLFYFFLDNKLNFVFLECFIIDFRREIVFDSEESCGSIESEKYFMFFGKIDKEIFF